MDCFDAAPEFIDEDNRRFRISNPVTKSQSTAKHEAILPADVVRGKTILDLGCCLGATGHWCLYHGAAHYTGVEAQKPYTDIGQRLMEKYHPGKYRLHTAMIEEWLRDNQAQTFDIVCILGVLYVFSDYYSILKYCADITRDHLMVEAQYPPTWFVNNNFCGVEFTNAQTINSAAANVGFSGRGSRISPRGMRWLMKDFGFEAPDGVIKPQPVTDTIDVFNSDPGEARRRYMMCFSRTAEKARSLSDALKSGSGKIELWD